MVNATAGRVFWTREYILDAAMLKRAWGETGGK